ncbi:hypothetical protein MNBD_GAMMA12-1084 [hydrothermal vent metagenome]|uniref:Uncharacterized protein n=1 Tax=hydrothermal vent metagenome TaxID=652676 RepID=A0A3B0YU29_9ZZZZ
MNKTKHILISASLLIILAIILIPAKSDIQEYHSDKDYSDIMANIQQGLIDQGYEIEKVQAVNIGLAKAGFTIQPYKVIFFNPKHTLSAIHLKYPGFSALLPLSITVAKEDEQVRIVSSPFKFLINAAPKQDLRALVKIWKQHSHTIIVKALKESATGFPLNKKLTKTDIHN